MIDTSFWKDRRVFLTGHTGFKGSWLALWLAQLGAKVDGYALAPETRPNLFDAANVAAVMQSQIGDVRDAAKLADAIQAARPDVVFHLAAQSLVRTSYAKPRETFETNVLGTVNVLEAVRHCDTVRAVVVVTSDKCYENLERDHAYREGDALGGHDPYSASKACAELVTGAYRRSFFAATRTGIASARAGNVIGGGDWAADRLLPDLVRAFGAGRAAQIRNPGAVRPWQHVLDPLAGYLILAERLCAAPETFAQAWNFGPDSGDVLPVREVADRMVALWGDGAAWAPDTAPQPHEARLLMLDAAKAREKLGWHPRLPVHEALEWTVRWYRQCAVSAGSAGAKNLALEQIDRYMQLQEVTV